MVVLIGVWGSRERKISAAYQLFLFTFLGSVFILLSLLVLYSHFGLVRDFN
jgi:NADH:ubiquinone oxidoreductase subunit 4 (subunit M)